MTSEPKLMRPSEEVRLVYVEYGTENNADGAVLMGHPEDKEIERTRDRNLIEASLANDETQGVIYARKGVDGHWHLAERALSQGYCPEPTRSVPPPGAIGLDLRVVCPACGKRCRVTVRGLFARHKPPRTP